MSNVAKIRLVGGDTAPRAHEYGKPGSMIEQVKLLEVVITEQGTQERLPIVDFVCEDAAGRTLFLSLTGRIVNGISAAVKGANERNHGTAEP